MIDEIPRYEYICPSGEYGTLEDTINTYGQMGWRCVSVEFNFRPNGRIYHYQHSAVETLQWCAVLERPLD